MKQGRSYQRYNQRKAAEELIPVDVNHVSDAFDESSKSSLVHIMRGLRKFEVLVLIALFLEQKEEKVSVEQIQDRCQTIID